MIEMETEIEVDEVEVDDERDGIQIHHLVVNMDPLEVKKIVTDEMG